MFGKKEAEKTKDINILFVCMGNICRSPTAHGVFQHLVKEKKLENKIAVDSAGTYAYQAGKKPDSRAIQAAAKRGYNLSKLRARKIEDKDFEKFDLVLAMDSDNHKDLTDQSPKRHHQNKVKYFLEFSTSAQTLEVPDPYYGGAEGFEKVLDMVEEASKGLLTFIERRHLSR